VIEVLIFLLALLAPLALGIDRLNSKVRDLEKRIADLEARKNNGRA
jgi:hypothetical protein